MKTSLVTADYHTVAVTFTEEGWFNATAVAEHYGKRVADWLETHDTQEYLTALAALLKVPKKALLKAKRGRYGGTWMHPRLGVPFARWLDVGFGVWCDDQIYRLLTRNHPHYDWKRLRHEATSSHKVMCQVLQMTRERQGKSCAPHHFSNETRLVNWALTGDFKGLDRETLTPPELDRLARLEECNAVLVGCGLDYTQRKTALEQFALPPLLSSPPEALHAHTP